MTKFAVALASGMAGAAALTLCHEIGRRVFPDAPRMDVLGMRAISRALTTLTDSTPPPFDQLHTLTLAGDVVANSLYYSAVDASTPAATWRRGVVLGALAGVGALILPQRMGLGTPPHVESTRNKVLTVAWYLIGGFAAAGAANGMRRRTA
jgi:hypothetical protein